MQITKKNKPWDGGDTTLTGFPSSSDESGDLGVDVRGGGEV